MSRQQRLTQQRNNGAADAPGLRHLPAAAVGVLPGAEIAFRERAMHELDAVYRMAFYLGREPADAEDIALETYRRALGNEDVLRQHDVDARFLLFKMLHSVVFTGHEVEEFEAESMGSLDIDYIGDTEHLDAPCCDLLTLESDRMDECLKCAIACLPPRGRAALLLWAVENLRYREIADVMDTPLETVVVRLHRAWAFLSQQLASCAEDQVAEAPRVAPSRIASQRQPRSYHG